MRILLGAAVLLALAWGAPASAVIIASGDGTGNTSAPADDPGWANVVKLGGLTGVYLGNGWVLTAEHVGARDMIILGVVYPWVPGSDVQLLTAGPDPDSDLLLFQIVRDPGLPDVSIRSSPPPPTAEAVMIGLGYDRGAAYTSPCFPYTPGWEWGARKAMRWGTNLVEQNGIDLAISGTLTRAFSTRFDANLPTPHEAQVANGDSGGALFIKSGQTWELAGILTARSSDPACQPDRSAIYGNRTYAADLSFYLDQIDAITSVAACDDGVDQDGDGLVDYPDDPGCDDALDPFETSDALPCDDGIDNDRDGGADFDPVTYADPGDETMLPAGEGDPGCADPTWSTESPECQDGVHNDGDVSMDYDAGLSANGFADPAGPDPQCVGKPWRDREEVYPNTRASYPCGLGAELALLLPALAWLRRRG